MDTNNIPRDLPALQALSKAQRFRAFLMLQELEVTEEQKTNFLLLETEEQAAFLLNMMHQKDNAQDDVVEGYVVRGVALPERSSDPKKNKKRMVRFAKALQRTLNKLDVDQSRVSMMHFDSHGVIVVGYKQPQQQHMPFPFPFGMMPMQRPPEAPDAKTEPPPVSAMDDEDRQRVAGICSQAFTMVRLTDNEEVLDKNLDDFVDSVMNGVDAESTGRIITEIERLESEHAITHEHDEDCMLDKTFDKVKTRLRKRVELATN